MNTSKKVLAEMAQQGESLRLAGNYSKAIECFSEALKGRSNYAWAYAHRAAARGPLGSFKEAYADFAQARTYYRDYNYPWFLGQKAELFRLWARATLMGHQATEQDCSLADSDEDAKDVPEDDWKRHYLATNPAGAKKKLPPAVAAAFTQMSVAIRLFTKANDLLDGNPWILAHRGATRTMRYWVGVPTDRFGRGSDDDFRLAEEDFTRAYANNESYAWAYGYHAVLRGLRGNVQQGDPEKAIELIGRAHTSGLDRQLSVVRVMMELSLNDQGAQTGAPGLDDTLRLAWSALQVDSDESFARYFIANGLSRHLDSRDPDVSSAIKRARAELNGARARLLAMEGGLDCLEGKWSDACAKIEELGLRFDLDALALVRRDPAWRRVREGTPERPHVEKPGGLAKAHDLYTTLFAF